VQHNAIVQRQQNDREDIDILKHIQRTDQRALGSLYDRYAPVLYPFCLRMTESQEVASDIVNDVFAHVWEKANNYSAQYGSMYSWMAALCRIKAMDRIRSANQRRKGQEGENAPPRGASEGEQKTTEPETIVVLKGYTEEVRNSLKSLSKLELRLLELSYYEGQSQSDLARMLRIPLGTIKAKMRRGIQKLRQASVQEVK
jgi:RNA polymerase sigma-70 factor (ECF subfamily)